MPYSHLFHHFGGMLAWKIGLRFWIRHSKSHFWAPENMKITLFCCIFGLHSCRYNIYQVRIEFRKLFDILVHPTPQVTSMDYYISAPIGYFSVNGSSTSIGLRSQSENWILFDYIDRSYINTMWQRIQCNYRISRKQGFIISTPRHHDSWNSALKQWCHRQHKTLQKGSFHVYWYDYIKP